MVIYGNNVKLCWKYFALNACETALVVSSPTVTVLYHEHIALSPTSSCPPPCRGSIISLLSVLQQLTTLFQMISPTAFKQPTHRGVVSGMTRGNIIRMLELGRGARGRAPQSSAMTAKCNGITCAKEPLLKWRSAVVGFLAATCVVRSYFVEKSERI